MQKYLADLIDRMTDKSDHIIAPGFDSTKTNSWKATREAEKLDDPKYIPLLKTFIEKEEDERKRDRAYFILGHVAMNTSDASVSSFFIERIKHESDDVLSSMLLNLKPLFKSKGTDISPLIELLSSPNEEVKLAAIQALNHAEDEAAESALIKIVEAANEGYELLYALEVLRDSGTKRANAAIQRHINSKKKEVRTLAAEAMSEIKARK
jgi:HEAT repeat protein